MRVRVRRLIRRQRRNNIGVATAKCRVRDSPDRFSLCFLDGFLGRALRRFPRCLGRMLRLLRPRAQALEVVFGRHEHVVRRVLPQPSFEDPPQLRVGEPLALAIAARLVSLERRRDERGDVRERLDEALARQTCAQHATLVPRAASTK